MLNKKIENFVVIIGQLRNPEGGCPWDLKQNYQSMIPCLLEETYEVIEAIERNSVDNLREELGDLLLQVVFLSQLAAEENKFTFADVVNEVTDKIIRRHPHVFGDKSANNEQEALQNWNQVKALENQQKQQESILDNIPYSFPALMRAEKLQKRCAKVGFDWDKLEMVIGKVEEELQEVKEELTKTNISQSKVEEEMGDLFFASVNLSRHLGCTAEESLRQANLKFERRFRAIEAVLRAKNKSLQDCSLAELDLLWNDVKKEESTE